jgi:polyhydroxyalkanoate synthesis regulator phasin
MVEPQEAVMPLLMKIQQKMSAGRKDTKALQAKVNDIADTALEIREDIADMRRDTLMHLGLTTKHRSDFEALREEVADLKTRIAALEARS